MKINLIAGIDRRPAGANRAMAEFANQLAAKKHDVTLFKPIYRNNVTSSGEKFITRLRKLAFMATGPRVRNIKNLPWISLNCPAVTIPELIQKYLPACDATFFTFPNHLEPILSLGPEAGKKVMRVCDLFFAERVQEISADITLCANSSMVQHILEEKLQRKVYLLVNGVNIDIFNAPDKNPLFPTTIGMFFYPKSYTHKGMQEGFTIMRELKKRYPNLRFLIAGEKKKEGIPDFVEFRDAVHIKSLVEFYRNVDIFIYPSKYDACPNPPMEALACKCALVTTNVGGISDYTVPGKTAMVSLPEDTDTMLRNITALIESPTVFQKIVRAGYEKIMEFSTKQQGEILDKILHSVVENNPSQ